MLKNILFLSLILLISACATTKVSVLDNTAVGHRNIHVVFINDELDDELDVATYLIETFQKHGVSAGRKDSEPKSEKMGTGSGFVAADGYWLTNQHVVGDKKNVTISALGVDRQATVVATDKHLDLALLRGSTTGLRPIAIGTSKVGEEIFAIGYPVPDILGSKVRITSGLVSSLYGMDDDSTNIQISAPIQPGNSGGPVVNKDWQLVGVAVSSASHRYMIARTGAIPQGLNFAVSPNHVKGFLLQNGVQPQAPFASSMDEAIASSGLIWQDKQTPSNSKRVYYARFRYSIYFDVVEHIRRLNIQLVDAETGKVIATSKTESPGIGVEIPAEQAAEDILAKLGLIPGKM